MAIQVTYELAMAAGRDAANANMRKDGRTVWNKRDFYIAMCTTHKLLGLE